MLIREALQIWKKIAGKGDGGPSDDPISSFKVGDTSELANVSQGHQNSGERRNCTSVKDPAIATTDSVSKAKGNISDRTAVMLKKKAPTLSNKELNPEFFQKLKTRGSGEFPVEVVVARRLLKSVNSHSEDELETTETYAKKSNGNCEPDVGSVNSKYRGTERGNGGATVSSQPYFDGLGDINQRESSTYRVGISKTDGQSESFMNNKGNWLAIQRQLLQLERQQAHLMNMLQDFMGGSHDGMLTLENRVRGLERVIEDMSRDLSISGRRGGNYMMGFEESSNRHLGRYSGFPDYSNPKLARHGDGRSSFGERFATSDGVALNVRGRGPSWRSDMPESWDSYSYGRNGQIGSRRALGSGPMDGRSPKSDHGSDQGGSRRAWDKGVGPVRFGEGPSARSVWQASKDEATLEAIRVAGDDNGSARTARVAEPELTAEALVDDNTVPDRGPIWTSWSNAMDALHEGNMDSAFAEVLSTGDDLLLVKLMDRSGPVIDRLSSEVASEVLHAVAQFLIEQNLFDICLSWIQQLIDFILESGPDVLGTPMEVKRELLLNLNEALSTNDPPEDWEGDSPEQLLLQLASAWQIDLHQLEK